MSSRCAAFGFLLASLALPVLGVAAPPPGAQVLGPAWQDQRLTVTGDVLAVEGNCVQINVTRHDLEGFGRAWACWPSPAAVPALGARITVSGVVQSMRMTRMGPYWRPVPVLHPSRHR